ILWDVVDDSQVISSYIYVINADGKIIYQSYFPGNFNFSGLLTGNYSIRAKAKDSANNWGYKADTFIIS
ncbi:MAG: triple tyrosine motif-containing protein, partial [Nanoarchaeota archaeon]|nr:triple tyrosine motif-containing protein [Nanoarchaeota archaeon]